MEQYHSDAVLRALSRCSGEFASSQVQQFAENAPEESREREVGLVFCLTGTSKVLGLRPAVFFFQRDEKQVNMIDTHSQKKKKKTGRFHLLLGASFV